MRGLLDGLRRKLRPHSELDNLKKDLGIRPRRTPGTVRALGWSIDYVDYPALLSSLEVIVEKGWNDFLPENDAPVIIDCGANIGISVLNYKKKYPGAKIVAFEPDPSLIPILKHNIITNHINDVTVVEAAVWTCFGESDFYLEGADGSRLAKQGSAQTVRVRTVDLADYISNSVDLIKMDIEGAELDVIPHIEHKLPLVKNVIVECHINSDQAGRFGDLLKTLSDAGFAVSINSLGVWRDLIRKPAKLPDEADQYFLVAGTRCKS